MGSGGGDPPGAGAGAEAGAGGGLDSELTSPGTRFSVALAQFALYPSRVFASVGLMANTIPD